MAKRPPKPPLVTSSPRVKAKKSPSNLRLIAIDKAKKLIDSSFLHYRELSHSELTTASDRAIAILRSSRVENALEQAILGDLIIREGQKRALTRDGGPLSTFANKITMAFALGIIGEEAKDALDVIRHIRNVFAHSECHVSFETEEIRGLRDFLQFGKNNFQAYEKHEDFSSSTTRDYFSFACSALHKNLLLYTILTIEEKSGQLVIKHQKDREEAFGTGPICRRSLP